EVGLGALHRRTPVDAGDVEGLVDERVGEDADAGGDDARGGLEGRSHDALPIRETARRAARALDRWTSAPASARARVWRSRPWASPLVPTQASTTRRSRPSPRAVSMAPRMAGASVAAGSASAPCPSTTSMRTTPTAGLRLTLARCSSR